MRKVTYSHLFPNIKPKSTSAKCSKCQAVIIAAVLKWTPKEGERAKLKCECEFIEICEIK